MRLLTILLGTISLLVSSCATKYYQLYQTKSPDVKATKKQLVYENPDIKLEYNLWADQGTSGFFIYNKSDTNMFVDLGKSHVIINEYANTYYQNRISSQSSTTTTSSGTAMSTAFLNTGILLGASGSETVTNESSVYHDQKRVLCIPSHAGKSISGFNLRSSIYRDCNILRFPNEFQYSENKSKASKTFTKEKSPVIIRNIVTYGFGESNINKEVENEFWVSKITNYPAPMFHEMKRKEFCDEKSLKTEKHYLYYKPGNFYIKYDKEEAEDDFEH